MDLPNYASKRFLIADDEIFMLGLIERMLKQCNTGTIIRASDGRSAFRAIKDNFTQVDCIIADFNMEPMNGLQLLQAIRLGINPAIPRDQPFVMLTGHGDADVVKAAIALDVSGYVVKPVALDKLVQTIEKVFRRPLGIKSAQAYREVKLPELAKPEKKIPPWVIVSGEPTEHTEIIKEKIKAFRHEHGTRSFVKVEIKNQRTCNPNELTEGMILAQNIEAEAGDILLRRGTQLTRGMILRIQEIATTAAPELTLSVGDLAG